MGLFLKNVHVKSKIKFIMYIQVYVDFFYFCINFNLQQLTTIPTNGTYIYLFYCFIYLDFCFFFLIFLDFIFFEFIFIFYFLFILFLFIYFIYFWIFFFKL